MVTVYFSTAGCFSRRATWSEYRTARDHLRVAGGHGDAEDEFTPRELGLLAGVGWATVARLELVTQVAKGGLCPRR